jgi:hypothetical protein
MNNPNSFDEEVEDATIANPEAESQGTEPEAIDYKTKFTFSSQEAMRLKAENDRKDAIIAELEASRATNLNNSPDLEEELYPNFNDLDEDAKQNLLAYTETVKRSVREDIYKDPALAFARSNYNEKKWDDAFSALTDLYPDIKTNAHDFKTKYFNPQNVPENISEILQDVAKIYLFDKAEEIGAQKERSKADRIEHDVATGGEKTPSVRRSMEDWLYMSQTNPVQFAKLDKEYQADSKHF